SAWSHPTIGGDIWASPAVAPPPGGGMGGVVYAVSNASAVTAFDAASGTQLWQAPLNPRDQLHATPLVVGDRLYVASMNHHLYYLDRGTGTPISWTDPAANTAVDSFRAFGEFRAAPIVDRDRLIAISNDHFLYGLDWEYPRPIVGAFRPAAAPPVLDLTKGAGQEAPPVPPEMLQEEVGAALQLALGAIVAADAKALAPYLQEEDPTKRDIYAVAALEAYRPFALKEFQLTSVTPATAGDAVATVVWEATRNGSPVQLILALHVLKDAIRDPAWRIEPGTLKPVRVIDIPVLSAPHGETAPATSNPPAEPPADASGGH
ncbi:MAG TPA: PQQ-binding-like beta-propeller repeat protein, partial [bacterium]|nr:PQQ-binding-like beta-propeller repeat protein [bacterium]